MEKNDETWVPLYFEEQIDTETGEKSFIFNDKYWINRSKGDWSECPDIY